ncbi:MAG TPA: hypothetical protein VIC26_02555 [Marinagarivorans sp.]
MDKPIHGTNSERPIFDAILADPALREQYHAQVQHLMDPAQFFTYQEWKMALDQGLPANGNNQDGRGAGIYGPDPGVLNFVRERTSNVQQQLNGTLP